MKLPMFPLGTVLMPGQLLPLHIFEDRYKAMIADVRNSVPPIFGVVLIERGIEVGGNDIRRSVGTCARILRLHDLEDGRLALIAGGTNRILIKTWLNEDEYPSAEIVDFPDEGENINPQEIRDVYVTHRRIAAFATESGMGNFSASDCDLSDLSLALFTMISESPLGPWDRQRLLEIPDLSVRKMQFTTLLSELEETLWMELGRDAD